MTKLKVAGLAACGCLILSAVGLVIWSNRPVTTFPNLQGVQGAATPVVTYSLYKGRFFSTQLPDSLTLKTDKSVTKASQVEQYLWTGASDALSPQGADQLAITVARLPADGISGVSDVQYRSRNNPLYLPLHPAWTPASSLSFILNNPDGYEESVFMPHKQMFASVVISGNKTRSKQLEAILKKVVENWQW